MVGKNTKRIVYSSLLIFLISGCSSNAPEPIVKNTDKDLKTKSVHDIKRLKGRYVSYSEYESIKRKLDEKNKPKVIVSPVVKIPVEAKVVKPKTTVKKTSKVATKQVNKSKGVTKTNVKNIPKKKIATYDDMSLKSLINTAIRKRDHSSKMQEALITKLPMEYKRIDVDMAIEDIRMGITQTKLKELKQALKY